LDRQGVEELKTHFYRLHGWCEKTGFPKKETLVDLGLGHVAEVLSQHQKLA
jgi:aldehyde:ferredoxin oxidoreductase